MMGRLLGSSSRALDLGEYYGHYFARVKAPAAYRRVPSDRAPDFLDAVRDLALAFPEQLATEAGCDHYVDASPWNLLIANQLARDLPDAAFVLVLRSWAGVCQSLERSYDDGYEWAGATTEERAAVWADLYQHVDELPVGRTVAVSYDRLCAEPGPVLARLREALANLSLPGDLDLSVLAASHATGSRGRMVIGDSGATRLLGRPSHDRARWTTSDESSAERAAGKVASLVGDLFPTALREGVQLR
jgi:predicted Fe-S protein YdhL (DUF1289 family)